MNNLFLVYKQISTLASIRILIPNDLLPLEARENTLKKISEVLSRFPKGVPLLDPEEDLKVRNSTLKLFHCVRIFFLLDRILWIFKYIIFGSV